MEDKRKAEGRRQKAEGGRQTVHVNTSGWEVDEVEQLDAMVKDARVDRSKFLRALIRKEWVMQKAEKA